MTKCVMCTKKATVKVEMEILEQPYMHDFIHMEGENFSQELCAEHKKTINPQVAKVLKVIKIKAK